ncbi:hypothetical protein ACROYT_G008561 [Oculina patagonica]
MAEDFEDNRSQFQGDVMVARPAPAPGIHRTSCIVTTSTCSLTNSKSPQYSMPPSTSSDSMIKGNSNHTFNHNHNHHGSRRHHGNKHYHSNGKVNKEHRNVDRFSRTATVLRQAGLMKLTLQIAQLIKTNEDLQKEIDELQKEAVQFSENLKSQLQQKLEANGNSELQQEKK